MRKTPLFLFLSLAAFAAFSALAAEKSAGCGGRSVSVDSCGADRSGKTDSSRAFEAALAAAAPGGTVTIPRGSYALSRTIAITKPVTISCSGTIRPFRPPAGGMFFFNVTSGNVTFDGHGGACVFDGISAAYQNFVGAINASGPNDYIDGVRISGIHVKNLALGLANGPYEAISLNSVKNCVASDNVFENSGPTKLYAGGYAIYMQYTQDCIISGNRGSNLGGSFINDSAGLRNRFVNNHVSHVTLFAFKGGYGTGFAVTNAGRPGTRAFTIADSAPARSAFASGKYINILDPDTYLEGTVDHWVAGDGFLTIFMKEPMNAAPKVGDQIEPLSTSLRYIGNSCEYTGDNCYDINGWHDIENTNTVCRYAGLYQPTGAPFGGLATCIWMGYDPHDANGSYRGIGARITGTDADHVGGTGIMVTEGVGSVTVDNYRLNNINELNKVGSIGCGIALNPLNTHPNSRGADLHIGRGSVTASTPNACMAWLENSVRAIITGMTGTATNGIMVDAGEADVVQDNMVTATGTADGTYAYAIGPGGGLHQNGALFRNNRGRLTASSWGNGHGYGFVNQSDANSGIDMDGSNSVTAPAAAPGRFIPRAGPGVGR